MTARKTARPIIQLKKLTKIYGIGDAAHDALDEIDLTIREGEFIAVMGPSGCGKTTLLNIIGFLDRPDQGEYLFEEHSTARLSERQYAKIRSNKIGIVFQSFNLINRLTVLENVALPLIYKGVPRVKRLEMASSILKSFHLQEREYYMPWQLSGGQMQRVAIARALVNKPSIILADEPTGNLDSLGAIKQGAKAGPFAAAGLFPQLAEFGVAGQKAIEHGFKFRMDAAQAGNDFGCPVEVASFAFWRPIGRR